VLDGPSDLTVYASSTATEVELTATLNVVAPDGTVVKQADGVLLGSQRAGPGAELVRPGRRLLAARAPVHPGQQQPVVPGRTTATTSRCWRTSP
jgi:predicted acyl esterase